MSHINTKKQEEKNLERIKKLLLLPENKKCFDCPTRSPFFVNVSIQTFICARCSGLVREVGHRVKSISASKFSEPEVVALEHGGNEVARTIWLSTYNMSTPDPETDGDVRMFMRQKYYEQKWLDRKKGVEHAERVKQIITKMYSDRERQTEKPKEKHQSMNESISTSNSSNSSSSGSNSSNNNNRPKMVPTASWVDDNVPIALISTVQSQLPNLTSTEQIKKLTTTNIDHLLLNDNMMLSPKSPTFAHNASKRQQNNDIFSELADLDPPTSPSKPIYSGGILQPQSPSSPSTPSLPNNNGIIKPAMPTTTINHNNNNNDPYAALRDLSFSRNTTNNTSHVMNNNNSNTMFSDLDPLYKR
ncbi:hypothetical protein RMCBS344292_11702 [Rhizopus microsporus]|nr:hypothetical protein RMCBS344292_11702 [Rhizopus microsporus]